MTEKTIKSADETLRRTGEIDRYPISVDKTKTPEQEIREKKPLNGSKGGYVKTT